MFGAVTADDTLSSAAAKSAALPKRSAGNFSSARSTAASTDCGMDLRCVVSRAGSLVITLAAIDWAVGPVKGGSPTSISYSTHPREKTSLRPVISRSPIACSGLMYCGVPSDIPVSVILLPPALLAASAIPKSATSTRPSCRRMFSGLMSRWITPCRWA